jgi:hypothetical protein
MNPKGIVFLVSLPIPILAGVFWHWNVFGLYRSLGDRVRNLSYYWFSFQFQNPWLASQLPGYTDPLRLLPNDLSPRVVAVRRRAKVATYIAGLWAIFFICLLILPFGKPA